MSSYLIEDKMRWSCYLYHQDVYSLQREKIMFFYSLQREKIMFFYSLQREKSNFSVKKFSSHHLYKVVKANGILN